MKNYIFPKPFLLLTIFLSFFLLTSNNANAGMFQKKLPTTPISVPIDVSKKGNKTEIDLRIENKAEKEELEPENTAFELEFFYDDPRRSEAFWKINDSIKIDNFYLKTLAGVIIEPFYWVMEGRKHNKKYTKEEWAEIMKDYYRVKKLVGDSNAYYKKGDKKLTYEVITPGALIPQITLTIINLDNKDKEVIFNKIVEAKIHPDTGGDFIKYLETINIKPGNYKIIAEVMSDAPEFLGTKVMLIIGSYRGKV